MLTKFFCLSVLLLSFGSLAYGDNNIVTISDAAGDENVKVSDTLVGSDAVAPGDLDLVSLTAKPSGNATMFEITFAKPIKVTDNREVSSTGMTLNNYAPNGFYEFNLDVYVDTDGIPGSGHATSLPGRNADFGSGFGWEKVICLAPRPQYARFTLEDELEKVAINEFVSKGSDLRLTDVREIQNRVASEMEQSVYFPTLISIQGSKIQFSVPDSFFHGKAKRDWRYTAGVTISNIVMLINHPGSNGPSHADAGYSDILQHPGLIAYENLPVRKQESAYVDLILQK